MSQSRAWHEMSKCRKCQNLTPSMRITECPMNQEYFNRITNKICNAAESSAVT
jgi:hypothetical protein